MAIGIAATAIGAPKYIMTSSSRYSFSSSHPASSSRKKNVMGEGAASNARRTGSSQLLMTRLVRSGHLRHMTCAKECFQETGRLAGAVERERNRRRLKLAHLGDGGCQGRRAQAIGRERPDRMQRLEPSCAVRLLAVAAIREWHHEGRHAGPNDVERGVVAALADRELRPRHLTTQIQDRALQSNVRPCASESDESVPRRVFTKRPGDNRQPGRAAQPCMRLDRGGEQWFGESSAAAGDQDAIPRRDHRRLRAADDESRVVDRRLERLARTERLVEGGKLPVGVDEDRIEIRVDQRARPVVMDLLAGSATNQNVAYAARDERSRSGRRVLEQRHQLAGELSATEGEQFD